MRKLPGTFAILATATVLAACPPPGEQTAAGLATEADTTRCATTERIYKNHGTLTKELFVTVSHECGLDTLPPITWARVSVRDSAGNVVNNQQDSIAFGDTHRGSFLVPGGGTVRVECPRSELVRHGCPWKYSLTVRF